jgi:hypothetical protein
MLNDVNIFVIDEEDISDDLDIAIRDGLVECFPPDVEYFSKQSFWHSRPKWRTLAKDHEGQIVGHVAMVVRDVLVGGKSAPVRVAGIQSVFVRSKMKGVGLSDKIMEKSMQRAYNDRIDTGLLFCIPKFEKTYSRMGWQKIDADVLMLDEQGSVIPIPGKNITMIYPLVKKDFPVGDINLAGLDW